jgi:hypothetical protein
VNRERGSSNNTLTGNIYLQDGNEIVSSLSKIRNIFNKSFVETGSKFICDKTSTHIQTTNNKINLRDSFALLEITETELIKVIQGMKNKKKKKKTAGLDDISPYS